MQTFIKRLYKAAKQYTFMDYACLKPLYLPWLPAGSLLFEIHLELRRSARCILLSYAWIMYRTLIKYR